MPRKQQTYSAEFEFQVALEAAKGQKTVDELASQVGVHPNRVSEWKQTLLKQGAQVFASSTKRQERGESAREVELYEQIGRLKMELEWRKKMVARFS